VPGCIVRNIFVCSLTKKDLCVSTHTQTGSKESQRDTEAVVENTDSNKLFVSIVPSTMLFVFPPVSLMTLYLRISVRRINETTSVHKKNIYSKYNTVC